MLNSLNSYLIRAQRGAWLIQQGLVQLARRLLHEVVSDLYSEHNTPSHLKTMAQLRALGYIPTQRVVAYQEQDCGIVALYDLQNVEPLQEKANDFQVM